MFALNNPEWSLALQDVMTSPCVEPLKSQLKDAMEQGEEVLPHPDLWFRAFELTPPESVKVVILGQDPYPTPGHATGLSFSVPEGVQLPKSLKNIFLEMTSDLKCEFPTSGDLTPWAKQGVLLLNTCLTVKAGARWSHKSWGWWHIADAAVEHLYRNYGHIVFILWGNEAHKKEQLFANPQHHKILKSPHPSPLSAYRGFFGSKPFSQCNKYLKDHGRSPIDWHLP